MNQCCYISVETNETKCSGTKKYGTYCYKHRRNFLIENNLIKEGIFTGLRKDYLKIDLESYSHFVMGVKPKNQKKDILFLMVKKFITRINGYDVVDINSLIKIQSLVRGNRIRDTTSTVNTANMVNTMSAQCNNLEDFYTYEKLGDIKSLYFYSYKDKNKIRWGFDIRSLDKLIELKYPNPYTTEILSPRIISDVKHKLNEIKKRGSYENISDLIERDRSENIKQKAVDLFSMIEQSGYFCQIDWFFNLGLHKIKELYKQLEDIWNYRSQLSNAMKRDLCPPDGRIFTTSIPEVLLMGKEDIQELILNDIVKFNNCQSEPNRRLGYMYFIIGLGSVSNQCYASHNDWLAFI